MAATHWFTAAVRNHVETTDTYGYRFSLHLLQWYNECSSLTKNRRNTYTHTQKIKMNLTVSIPPQHVCIYHNNIVIVNSFGYHPLRIFYGDSPSLIHTAPLLSPLSVTVWSATLVAWRVQCSAQTVTDISSQTSSPYSHCHVSRLAPHKRCLHELVSQST